LNHGGVAFNLMERLVAFTHELADLSRELCSNLLLRNVIDPRKASGQLLFDGVVWWFESAQSQFRCQIVHRLLSASIFMREPVPGCGDPALPQLPNTKRLKAPPSSEVVPLAFYALVLEECMNIRFSTTFTLFIRHLARLSLSSKIDRIGSGVVVLLESRQDKWGQRRIGLKNLGAPIP
jgi:hypothetical protein